MGVGPFAASVAGGKHTYGAAAPTLKHGARVDAFTLMFILVCWARSDRSELDPQ